MGCTNFVSMQSMLPILFGVYFIPQVDSKRLSKVMKILRFLLGMLLQLLKVCHSNIIASHAMIRLLGYEKSLFFILHRF